jgi:hypothetical protein
MAYGRDYLCNYLRIGRVYGIKLTQIMCTETGTRIASGVKNPSLADMHR